MAKFIELTQVYIKDGKEAEDAFIINTSDIKLVTTEGFFEEGKEPIYTTLVHTINNRYVIKVKESYEDVSKMLLGAQHD